MYIDYGFLVRSVLLQVIVFCSIPFIGWLLKKRKEISFFEYVGLRPPKKSAKTIVIAIFVVSYIVVYGIVHFVPYISALTQPSASVYEGLRSAAIIPAILVAFIQQAFAEEVLFRGFLGKRFCSKMGFYSGNTAQAIVFGSMHVLFSVTNERDFVSYLIIFVSTAAGGWLLGYLDEKLCGGSIVPSVLLHGLGNFRTIMTVAFFI